MRNTIRNTRLRRIGVAFAALAIRIFPYRIQKLLVERFDSFGLELQKVRVNRHNNLRHWKGR